MYYFAYYLRFFTQEFVRKVALHEKIPDFGCSMLGIVRPTFNLTGAKLFLHMVQIQNY